MPLKNILAKIGLTDDQCLQIKRYTTQSITCNILSNYRKFTKFIAEFTDSLVI